MYWADAICINQGDVGERSAQVAMMGKIFRSSAYVLAWFGQPDAGVSELFPSPCTAAA